MDIIRRLLRLPRTNNNYVNTGTEEEGFDPVLFLGHKLAEQPDAREIQHFLRELNTKTKDYANIGMPTECYCIFEDQVMNLRHKRSAKMIMIYKLSNIMVSCVYAKNQKILAIFYHNEDGHCASSRRTGLECHLFECGSKLHARTLAEKISTYIMSSYLQRQREMDVMDENQTLAKYVTYENAEGEYMEKTERKKRKPYPRIPKRSRGGSKTSNASTETSTERLDDESNGRRSSTDLNLRNSLRITRCHLTLTAPTADEYNSEYSAGFEETESSRAFKTGHGHDDGDVATNSRERPARYADSERLQCARLRHWRKLNDDNELSDSSTSTSNFEHSARIKLDMNVMHHRDSLEADVSAVDDSAVEDTIHDKETAWSKCKSKGDTSLCTQLKDDNGTKHHKGTTIRREPKSDKQRKSRKNRDSNRSKSFTASETLNHIPIQTLSWYGQRSAAHFDFSDSPLMSSKDSLDGTLTDTLEEQTTTTSVAEATAPNIDDSPSATLSTVTVGSNSEKDERIDTKDAPNTFEIGKTLIERKRFSDNSFLKKNTLEEAYINTAIKSRPKSLPGQGKSAYSKCMLYLNCDAQSSGGGNGAAIEKVETSRYEFDKKHLKKLRHLSETNI